MIHIKRQKLISSTQLRGYNTQFKIGPAVRPGRTIEKKSKNRTGQDMTGQDSQKRHKVVILCVLHLFAPIWGETSTVPSETTICMASNLTDVIMCAKYYQGLQFYTASDFSFSYRFLHGPYNTAALMRCL